MVCTVILELEVYTMLDFKTSFRATGLKTNVETKLSALKMSNPLYYHLFGAELRAIEKRYKQTNNIDAYCHDLEGLLVSIDDVYRGAD